MVALVQRPRGPLGHSPQYSHLPWPSDVTDAQKVAWLDQFERGDIGAPRKTAPALVARGLLSKQEIAARLDDANAPPPSVCLRLSLSVAGRVQAQIEVSLSPAPPLFVGVPSSLVSLAAAEETGKSLLSLVTECVREGYRLGRSETLRAQGEA